MDGLHHLHGLLEGVGLRRSCLAFERVQIKRAHLQHTVDTPRQQLTEIVDLQRLGAVGQVAARGLVRLEVLH